MNENGTNAAHEKARLDRGGFFDTDIYDSSTRNKYDQYVQSIAVDDVDVSSQLLYLILDENELNICVYISYHFKQMKIYHLFV